MFSSNPFFNYLLELNQEAGIELIKAFNNSSNKKTHLIFPSIRNTLNRKRVSEQELRFAFTSLHDYNRLNYLDLNYAIEVPTTKQYQFKGLVNQRSAATDMAFFEHSERKLNIEFKAHNPDQNSFDKDLLKLVNEELPGAWCHLLENENTGTIKSVLNKISNGLINATQSISVSKGNNTAFSLYISILILKKNLLIVFADENLTSNDFTSQIASFLQTYNVKTYNSKQQGKYQIGNWYLFKL